jgi:F0F1-type ATP synthase assembly protein I
MRSAATLVAIPSLLIVSPLVGFFLGDLGDKKFHTSPWLSLAGLVLGFAAGGREVWIIYRRYLESQER